MKKSFGILVIVFITLASFSADKPAWKLFNSKGKEIKYKRMIADLADADMVFFGELHNNPIAHWLELEIMKSLYESKGSDLIVGAEMFETDNQLLLDEYLSGLVSDSRFEVEARLWKNYKTDYKPLVTFARDSGLSFVADNVPRRYASLVAQRGFEILDSLSVEAKQFLPPLPIPYDPEVKCYKDMLDMMGNSKMPHSGENFPKAQALKDATMAHFIYKNWKRGKIFLHFNGSYHSDRKEGIVWYLRNLDSTLVIRNLTIKEVSGTLVPDSASKTLADYIIVVPEDMTKTY